jgi:hypothetical protein
VEFIHTESVNARGSTRGGPERGSDHQRQA